MKIISTLAANSYHEFSPNTAKYKIQVIDSDERIDWVRKTAKGGFMIVPSYNDTTIYLFSEVDYMMYLLKWT